MESAGTRWAMQDEADEEFGVRQLIAALLSPATLAHVLLLVFASVALLATTSKMDGGSGYTAVIITALAAAQVLTALVARSERGLSMLSVKGGAGLRARLIASLRSLLLPILFTGLIAVTLLSTVAAEESARATWALAVAGLFIAWSAGQALSFRAAVSNWTRGRMRCADETPRDGGLRRFAIIAGFEQLLVAGAIAVLFGQIIPDRLGRQPEPLIWLGFVAASIGLYSFGIFLGRKHLRQSLKTVGGAALAHRWALFCFAFGAWHMASLWRRVFSDPDDVVMLAEEAFLMTLTVFTAVWSLSSRSMKGGSRLFTDRNALFWALAFGYGYAGSIILLTDLTDGLPLFGSLPATLGMGHGITALTLAVAYGGPLAKPIIRPVDSAEGVTGDARADPEAGGAPAPVAIPDSSQMAGEGPSDSTGSTVPAPARSDSETTGSSLAGGNESPADGARSRSAEADMEPMLIPATELAGGDDDEPDDDDVELVD